MIDPSNQRLHLTALAGDCHRLFCGAAPQVSRHPMRRRGRPSLDSSAVIMVNSVPPSPAAHGRLAADRAGAKQALPLWTGQLD